MKTSVAKGVGLACALAWMAGCGSDAGVDIGPAVAPFVGTWDAVVFTVTPDPPTPDTVDVLASFGAFWISIEPSGQYTATIEFPNAPPDLGQLTVQSSTVLILDSTADPPAPSSYVFATPDSLVLDGATDFDFNADFIPEPAQAHIELLRR